MTNRCTMRYSYYMYLVTYLNISYVWFYSVTRPVLPVFTLDICYEVCIYGVHNLAAVLILRKKDFTNSILNSMLS